MSEDAVCCIAPQTQICQGMRGLVRNINPSFSGKSLLPCPDHFKRSVFTARPGSIPFLLRFHAAAKQEEVLKLRETFSTP